MNIPVRHATAATKLAIVDCEHPSRHSRKPSDLYPFLPAQWREHMNHVPASTCARVCPASSPGRACRPRAFRVDAFPEDGPRLRSRIDAEPAS